MKSTQIPLIGQKKLAMSKQLTATAWSGPRTNDLYGVTLIPPGGSPGLPASANLRATSIFFSVGL